MNGREFELTCPRCGKMYNDWPAVSRKDGKTLVCPECGTREALEEFSRWYAESQNVKQDREEMNA